MIRRTEQGHGDDATIAFDEPRATISLNTELSPEPAATIDELREEIEALRRQLGSRALREIRGQSAATEQLRQAIASSNDDDPILIQGAHGTDVDAVAAAIHSFGKRAHRPLVKLDCRLLSAERLEQELHLARQSGRSASNFSTDAQSSRLSASTGGTVLLMHIEAVPIALQRQITMFIREQRACAGLLDDRLSANRTRVLVSTHADLKSLMQKKQLRADLVEELGLRTIALPSLQDRISDVGLLAEQFIAAFALAEGITPPRLTIDGLRVLQNYSWPGNDAELRRVIERACSVTHGELISAEAISSWIATEATSSEELSAGLSLSEMERRLIETTFARCEGNRERTAQVLQIGLRTLSGKLREYGYPPRGGPGSNLVTAKLKAA
ncbi:MAG: sigma-54-dependent transcriptional regulator [Planctomycetaceae bacterium]